MSTKLIQLEELLRPVIEGLGYECWGIEYKPQGKHSMLRVYIDKTDGISVEDCEIVSRQISGVLDVEDPIQHEYTLEVSSPGMDRPLFRLEQFAAYAGHLAELRLRAPFEGRRKFKGILRGIEGQDIVLVVDEHDYLFPVDSIESAHVVPVFE